MSVNISARQLIGDHLVEFLSAMLKTCDVSPTCIELEITESIAMQHAGTIIEAFKRIGELGIRVAIDDFGTGHSSLDRLKRLPIHTLKIARPFVEDLAEGDDDAEAIIFAMIVLGHSMGLNVIAEGVETDEQLQILRSLGCDMMQGFLFSKAVPQADFFDMLRTQVDLAGGGVSGSGR
jgi:EAL domain-containing protein (putative c-di-GMP-specific phosphodiesterase class I)